MNHPNVKPLMSLMGSRLLTRQIRRRAREASARLRRSQELHRFRAEAQLASSPCDSAEAEASLSHALAVARDQEARFWELRVATRLARLWRDQGKRIDARDLLAPIYGYFTELLLRVGQTEKWRCAD
jgi:predicted ATPase